MTSNYKPRFLKKFILKKELFGGTSENILPVFRLIDIVFKNPEVQIWIKFYQVRFVCCWISKLSCASAFFWINLFLVALGLHCCEPAFSGCSEWGLLSSFSTSHCCGFSCLGAQALGAQASEVACLGSEVVVHRLSCHMAGRLLVPRPGIKHLPSALQGGFLTTGPPTKPLLHVFDQPCASCKTLDLEWFNIIHFFYHPRADRLHFELDFGWINTF